MPQSLRWWWTKTDDGNERSEAFVRRRQLDRADDKFITSWLQPADDGHSFDGDPSPLTGPLLLLSVADDVNNGLGVGSYFGKDLRTSRSLGQMELSKRWRCQVIECNVTIIWLSKRWGNHSLEHSENLQWRGSGKENSNVICCHHHIEESKFVLHLYVCARRM